MGSRDASFARRTLLTGALALPLAACGTVEGRAPAAPKSAEKSRSSAEEASTRFSSLERKYDARLGVYALATGTGASLGYREDERFAFCSTFKTLAAAAVLQRNPLSHLNKVITYDKNEVNSISPITERHIGTGMTIRQLCDAAIRYSDGTAGNLLMRDIGGPGQLTHYLRGLGDTASRMDQYEPELNRDPPGDPRDTTTPRSIAHDYRKIVLDDALPPEKRALIKDWLQRNTTGAQSIRAGVPHGWGVADKTGHGDYGRANDIAIVTPPGRNPLVIAILSDRAGYTAEARYPIIAEAAKYVVSVLG
ncbi:class A beta-lactamase [Sciscionella sediminilitoris]|uniref:class A beta-lactamase n=1 Tax=Sciscionella sediminilitoris TaxID=1445613 RepID=UPI0004DED5A2|nr:class A beta-lactamase [Sciscionella sp. SE31]